MHAISPASEVAEGRGSTLSEPTRILICDDHELVREGLRLLLGREAGLRVVGEAATASEAIEIASREHPDVVVIDLHLGDDSGIDAARAICAARPQTKVAILTGFPDDEALFGAIMAGAAAYLRKDMPASALVAAIRRVAAGELLIDRDAVEEEHRRSELPAQHDPALAVLTEREREIFVRLAQGKPNRAIAEAVGLSEKTVKKYVSAIYSKLGLSRRAQVPGFTSGTRSSSQANASD